MIDCKVVFVDDDQVFSQGFKSLFNLVFSDEKFELHSFSNPLEAEEYIKKNKDEEIAIIISDQRMVEKKGVDFLEKTIKLVPDAVRIMATGYAEEEDRVQETSINKAKVWHFFNKPWDEKILVEKIREAIIQYMRNKGHVFEDSSLVQKWIETGKAA